MLPCPKIVRGQQELTPEQKAYAYTFADARVAALLSTSPIDEQEAEEHLRDAYRVAGLASPTTIRWFDSPLSFVQQGLCERIGGRSVASLVRLVGEDMENQVASAGERMLALGGKSILASIDELAKSVWGSVRIPLLAGLQASLCERVGRNVSNHVWRSVQGGVRESKEKGFTGSIWASTGKRIDGAAGRALWEIAGYILQASVAAYYEIGHCTFHWFFHEVFEKNKLIHLARFNEKVSGYWLGKEEAWLVRKPVILQLDEWGPLSLYRGRLHNANGPCVQYRDGWGWYAWHGVRVPEKVILHPEQVTVEDWSGQLNVEVRRAIQERLGPELFVKLVRGVCIDKGRRGSLIRINLGFGDPERVAHYVQVQDSSTGRQYYLRVPPTITRADDAIAWTFGLDARDYQPGQET